MTARKITADDTRALAQEFHGETVRLAKASRLAKGKGVISRETRVLISHTINLLHRADDEKAYRRAAYHANVAAGLSAALETILFDVHGEEAVRSEQPRRALLEAVTWLTGGMADFVAWKHQTGGDTPRKVWKFQAAEWAAIQARARLDTVLAAVESDRGYVLPGEAQDTPEPVEAAGVETKPALTAFSVDSSQLPKLAHGPKADLIIFDDLAPEPELTQSATGE